MDRLMKCISDCQKVIQETKSSSNNNKDFADLEEKYQEKIREVT